MCNINTRWIRKRETEKNIWNNKDWEFSQFKVRHETTNPRSSENLKQENVERTTPKHINLKLQNIKYKEKRSWKRKKNTFFMKE